MQSMSSRYVFLSHHIPAPTLRLLDADLHLQVGVDRPGQVAVVVPRLSKSCCKTLAGIAYLDRWVVCEARVLCMNGVAVQTNQLALASISEDKDQDVRTRGGLGVGR